MKFYLCILFIAISSTASAEFFDQIGHDRTLLVDANRGYSLQTFYRRDIQNIRLSLCKPQGKGQSCEALLSDLNYFKFINNRDNIQAIFEASLKKATDDSNRFPLMVFIFGGAEKSSDVIGLTALLNEIKEGGAENLILSSPENLAEVGPEITSGEIFDSIQNQLVTLLAD